MESIQFKLTTFHESFKFKKKPLPINLLHKFSEFTSSFFNLYSRFLVHIFTSFKSEKKILEQSMSFVSCELLSFGREDQLHWWITQSDSCSRNFLTQNSCCIFILFLGLLKIGSLFNILVFPGLLETRESLREDCSLSVLRQ